MGARPGIRMSTDPTKFDLQTLRREGDLAVGGQRRDPELRTERLLRLGRRNNKDGSFNPEHDHLSSIGG